jgi:hypothetical protein
MHPLKGGVELRASTVGVEKGEHVYTNDGVETGPVVVKVSLREEISQ